MWEVGLRCLLRCDESLAGPSTVISQLERSVQALKARSAPHQCLVASWLCSSFSPTRCSQLAPSLLCLPFTRVAWTATHGPV